MELKSLTIGAYLQATVDKHPDRRAIIDEQTGRSLTWYQVAEQAEMYAYAFLDLGLEVGDRLVIWGTNQPEWVFAFLGAAKIGVCVVTLNTHYLMAETESILQRVEPKVIVYGDGFRDIDYDAILHEVQLRKQADSTYLRNLRYCIHYGRRETSWAMTSDDFQQRGRQLASQKNGQMAMGERVAGLNPDQVINIQFTSGTTSAQKGVMLTHYNLVNNSYFAGRELGVKSDDCLCLAVPFFHCFGLTVGILLSIGQANSMVLIDSYSTRRVLQAIEQYSCTVLHGVPTMFCRLLHHKALGDYNLQSVTKGILAGDYCPPEVLADIEKILGMKDIMVGYGQTECSPCCTQTKLSDSLTDKMMTAGQPLPFVEVVILDEGKEVEVGQTGEICTRGYHVMKGYYQAPELTKKAIDNQGYLHTGDLGFVDERGYLHFEGRRTDRIIRGGENIHPIEVESAMQKHVYVKDAKVVGLPSECYGQEVATAIQLQPEVAKQLADGRLDESQIWLEIKTYLLTKLAKYKIPAYIDFFDEYPMTASGKVKKNVLQEQLIRKHRPDKADKIEK